MSLRQGTSLFSSSIFSFLFLLTMNEGIAKAQVIPDGTLPTNVEQLENMQKMPILFP